MTHNQINYWTLQESTRHNLASEGETQRHNLASENIETGKLQETSRHNLATENIDISKLAETSRHNLASEGQGYMQLAETHRHNVSEEAIGSAQAKAALQNADTNAYNANTNRLVANETNRHNTVTEDETASHNDAMESVAQLEALTKRDEYALRSKLTDAQIDQINANIDQIKSNIKHMSFQNAQLVTQSINDVMSAFNNGTKGAKDLANMIAKLAIMSK